MLLHAWCFPRSQVCPTHAWRKQRCALMLKRLCYVTGIQVADVAAAYEATTSNGAEGVLKPTQLVDTHTDTEQSVAEIKLYGDVVLRFVSGSFKVQLLMCFPSPCALVDRQKTLQNCVDTFLTASAHLLMAIDTLQGPFLAGCVPVEGASHETSGLQRLDHAVGNVHNMMKTINYLARATGFHEFAEFTAEVGHLLG